MDKTYLTIADGSVAELDIKGSRFIACLRNCPDEGTVSKALDIVRSDYPDATHYCYAAIFNGSDRSERFSDNGEPSGTAGKPILQVLRGSGLSDIIVIVVRYFGGKLLGTGGLVQAYSETAKAALSGISPVEMIPSIECRTTLDYPDYGTFEKQWMNVLIDAHPDFMGRVSVTASVPVEIYEEYVSSINDITKGAGSVTKICQHYAHK